MGQQFRQLGLENSTRENLVQLVKANGEEIQRTPTFRVAICVPTQGRNPWGFTHDLAQLMCCTGVAMVSDGLMDIALLFSLGTYIDRNREDLTDAALEGNPTHLLWLDDDTRFPQDLLIRLLKRNKPIVGVNYTTRKIPCVPVAIKRMDEKERLKPGSGLEEVEAIGFGAVLIRADVFRAIRKPWFESYRDSETGGYIGEDVDFCNKCRAKGFEILVDHDLSKEIKHVGEFEYTLAHAEAWDETFGGNNGTEDESVHANAKG